MTLLVTGGAGFIGSHLVDHLLAETDDAIRILDNFSTGDSSNIEHLETPRVTIHEGDIRDQETVADVARDADAIYHIAAAVGVKKVVDAPLDSLRTNLHGTENVLDAARTDDIPVFIASTSEIYGKSEDLPFAEGDDRVLGPTDIPRWGYATAKATDEFLALSYHDEYGLPVTIGRYFNIVGPRQTGEYGMVIPRFVEQALQGDPITVYGDGTQTRSFTHVTDAVQITHELLETPEARGTIFNIGAPDTTSINELAERVLELTESNSEITHIPFEEAYSENFEEPDHREPDVSRLQSVLGWRPQTDLEQILEDVIAERQSGVVT